MADDDASINKATQAATRSALQELTKAGNALAAAARPFGKPVGVSWGDLAHKLAKRSDCAPHHRAFESALADATAAVARAQKAAAALGHVTHG